MPTYDFRCRACSVRREVSAAYEIATSLELVCVDCGGSMVKTVTGSLALLTRAADPPSSSSGRVRRPRGGDSCDAAIQLTRPNPFSAEVGRAAPGAQAEGD